MADADITASDDASLIEEWLHNRPASTARAYRSDIAALRKSLGGKPLELATFADLREHAKTLTGVAPRSQSRNVAAIKSFYAFHASTGRFAANPAAFLKPPRIPSDLADRILTEEDTRRLLAGAHGIQRVMLDLLYLGGLRAGELCGLRWTDIASGEGGSGKITVTGKGAKVRTINVPQGIFGDLLAMRPDDAAGRDPVFPATRNPGRPIGVRQLLDVIKRAAAAAGMPRKISLHYLRHCHASHALDAGAPITLVRDSLGHSNISITNRYAHSRPNDGSARFLRTGG